MPLSVILSCVVAFSPSGSDLPKPIGFSLDRFYKYPLLNGRSPAGASMSPDGSKIVFGWNQTGERRLDVWILDFGTGQKSRIIESSKIDYLPRQEDTRTELEKKEQELYDGGISNFDWAPDGKEIMFSYRGRVWLASPDGKTMRPLVDASDGIGATSYSPDGKYIGFLKGGNVWRYDRASGALKQLTFNSRANTSISGFTWSEDMKHIAVTLSDQGKMGSHVMMDFSKDRATVVNIRRMWHGEKSQSIKYGVVGAEGGVIKWIEGIPSYSWPETMQFSPDSSMLLIGAISEDFQQYRIWVAPTSTLKKATVYEEKAPKNYITDWRPAVWSRDSKSIIFGTDIVDGQFGWRSVFKTGVGYGAKPEKVFAESYDVVSLARAKNSDRIVLVTMARSPLKTEITILEPDGKRTVHVPIENGFATPKQFDEASAPLMSNDGKKIASMCSDRAINWELYSIEPKTQRLTQSQLPEFASIKWAEQREVTYKMPDGREIHAVLIQKPGLNTARKHPAFISNMYANSAKFAWNGYFENYAAMELGFVVLQIDYRGSWGYGGDFNSGYYKSMGIIDADESAEAAKFLTSLGYVDPERIGCWGWSYGGFLTCMNLFTKPSVFHAGVAVASVTDWKSYNEWYTRRRLGMETDDPEVYKKTSPVFHAQGLKDNLMLIHGMLDDNVLFQDTARLMQKLIDNEKHFDLMLYPRDDHGIGLDTSRPHVFVEVMKYLWSKLATN